MLKTMKLINLLAMAILLNSVDGQRVMRCKRTRDCKQKGQDGCCVARYQNDDTESVCVLDCTKDCEQLDSIPEVSSMKCENPEPDSDIDECDSSKYCKNEGKEACCSIVMKNGRKEATCVENCARECENRPKYDLTVKSATCLGNHESASHCKSNAYCKKEGYGGCCFFETPEDEKGATCVRKCASDECDQLLAKKPEAKVWLKSAKCRGAAFALETGVVVGAALVAVVVAAPAWWAWSWSLAWSAP